MMLLCTLRELDRLRQRWQSQGSDQQAITPGWHPDSHGQGQTLHQRRQSVPGPAPDSIA